MNITVKRGDIFYADLTGSIGSELPKERPVVVIQNDIANKYAPTVIIVPISLSYHYTKIPTHVLLYASVTNNLPMNSIVMVEQIRCIDKTRLRRKIGRVTENDLYAIGHALAIAENISKEINLRIKNDDTENEKIKKSYEQISKPLIITEGKTDALLIETAWRKLFPNEKMLFDCNASGLNPDEQKREGNARTVKQTIEYMANVIERPVIGLFDNDREGNEQFNGLLKDVFEEHDIKKGLRKHKTEKVWGLLLPVPDVRKLFVTEDDITQRYFVIEHYFSDDILKKYKMYGKSILGTSVFKINDKHKTEFANSVKNLDKDAFANFSILFKVISEIFLLGK